MTDKEANAILSNAELIYQRTGRKHVLPMLGGAREAIELQLHGKAAAKKLALKLYKAGF